ncbi:hypothetical protein [Pseudomonas monteilii]|uniref:hypothetical protein n=1 Tax=Pseudomonas monteilii TaxID=76759 RepID=UPI001CBDB4B9|nr:hypothetical protein [Pseudomonas monteilii]MBZ3665541.1 hypothetical protein [Pseudomonas monteilii]MBZ3670885.1 hypothetical protein [Pseudomonas monteilii]
MSKPTGGPAFPVPGLQDDESFNGMTLRDYFAAQVDVSDEVGVRYAEEIVGRAMPDFASAPLDNIAFWADYRAISRYIEADAMLAARVKP